VALKKFKPVTPGRREMSIVVLGNKKKSLRAKVPKSLRVGLKKRAGRNNAGRITVRHRGGGHKRCYRKIDFRRTDKAGIPGRVVEIEYDPNRTAFIVLVVYVDGEKRYHLAPAGIKVGDEIVTAPKTKIKVGNRMMLKNIPIGFEIYNLEFQLNKGGQVVRSAGSSAKLVSLEGKYAQVQLPSKEIRLVHKDCYATIGRVSNEEHGISSSGKAGRTRWKGRRPQVRGSVMNPRDHPHGGGEGKAPIGLKHPKTPWGMPALGFKTRRRKNTNRWILKRRREMIKK